MTKNICQIIGYFNQGNAQYYMKRVMMKNFSNKEYNFNLLIQNNMRFIYTKNYLGNNKNVFFFNNNTELALLIKKMDYLILSIDLNGWWKCIHDFDQKKIYYIGHGITNHFINDTMMDRLFVNFRKSPINFLLFCKKQYEYLVKHKKNVFKIGTLPQIDNLLCKSSKTSDILIVEGTDKWSIYGERINQYRSNIFNLLTNNFQDVSIYYKGAWGDNASVVNRLVRQYTNIKNITRDKCLAYDYFFCDIIICIHFTTTFLEALLNNSKAILITFDFLHNVDITQPGMKERGWLLPAFVEFKTELYPNLLVAHDFPTLIKHINTIKTIPNYFETEDYSRDKNQYIKDSIGEYVPNISKQIIDIIEKNELNISLNK